MRRTGDEDGVETATTRLGLVVADALSSALGGRLVAAASEGTVTLRFDSPVEAAHAAA